MSSSARIRVALSPSGVMGILTAPPSWIRASSAASATMALTSVATTSALTGPCTNSQIVWICSLKSSLVPMPILAHRLGLVVTPSTRPRLWASRISSSLAVSIKNFIKDLLLYHKSSFVTTQEALQTAFGAEKIAGAVFFGSEGFPPGNKGFAHRGLDQD